MLTGRAREIEILRDLLVRAARDEGSVALVVGEAGVGKTHLLAATRDEARARGFTTLAGRCFADTAQQAFAPWAAVLGSEALTDDAEGAALGPTDALARRLERMRRTLEAHADARPLLVTIDDLHWADRESLLVLRHVARFGLDGALLLVASIRAPDLDADENAALDEVMAELARSDRVNRLDLRRFDESEVAEMAESLAGAVMPQSIARAVFDETAGNALYVREVVRHLVDEKKLRVTDGRVASDWSMSELGLPPSVRHVVRQRLTRLSGPTVELVRALAVAATPARIEVVAKAAELAPLDALVALDEATKAGLVHAVGPDEHELTHAIVRRAVFEEMGAAHRARLHRALAEALASTRADAALVASHYHASRNLPGKQDGTRWAIEAADLAAARGAHERSAMFLAYALDLAVDPELALSLVCRRALSLADAMGHDAAVVVTHDALARMAELGELAHAPSFLADVTSALERGGAPRAIWEPLVRRGLVLAGDARDRAWARLTLLARPPVPVLRGPVWVARFAPHDPEAVALLRSTGDPGDFAATVDAHDHRAAGERDAMIELARAWRDPAASIRVLDACARDLFFVSGDVRGATALMLEVRALAENARSLVGEVAATVLLGCTWASLGDLTRAREAERTSRDLGARIGAMHRMSAVGPRAVEIVIDYVERFEPVAEETLAANASTMASRAIEPGSAAATLLDLARSTRAAATPFGFVALNLGILGAAIAGDRETAMSLFAHHLDALEALPPTVNEWAAGRDSGAAAAFALGVVEPAARYLALAGPSRTAPGCACFSSVDLSAARMHALLGDLDAAAIAFERAREGFRSDGRAPSLAMCDHDEALALVRAGEAADPRVVVLAERARARAAELGMIGWARSAERVRDAATRATEPVYPDGLSEREVEVLRLLASGLANKQIASRLFISVPTVERHVANVYGKIGARGRAAATAYAMKNGLIPT